MNLVLAFILFLLMISIDKERGLKLFLFLFFNFIILIITFSLISLGFHSIICSLIGCILVSLVVLFFVNGVNIKTKSSFYSIVIVLLFLLIFIFLFTKDARIAGFGYESFEEINMFSYDVHIDFMKIAIAMVLISLIGAMIDTSIAISSALYEVYLNNNNLSYKDLFLSGMNIGKDILCTTTNTLLFVFLGDFMTLVIWYYTSKYSFFDIINSKTFAQEVIRILFSALGCVSIIPVTSILTIFFIQNENY